MIDVSLKNLRANWRNYLLVLLPLLLVLIFSYYPIYTGFRHMFYRWNGNEIEEFVGLGNILKMFSDLDLLNSFKVLLIFIGANLFKMITPLVTAVVLHHIASNRAQYLYRICFIIPMIVPVMVMILMWKFFYEPNQGVINEFLRLIGALGPTETIAWLSNRSLVIPSLIFQRFPWVGAFGVLVYLAGLQNISKNIYEVAECDGAGPLRVFWNIELPLIMTQVRINLLLVTVNTIRGWQFVYLFLGESGGPEGIATVPGLYIFRKAFSQQFFGYGCAIGFLLFLVTVVLTWLNNRYVRVNK